MAWLAVYLIATAIIITIARQAHTHYDLHGGEKDFFELTGWDGTTPIFHARYLPEWLYYLPAWAVCNCYAALKYCWLNRRYYLNGKALRRKYAKRVLADAITRYDEHLRLYKIGRERQFFPGSRPEDDPWDECSALAPPTTDRPYAAGRKFHWDAAELYSSEPLDDAFVADLIRTPLQFWALVTISAAQLLLWPITVCARCVYEYMRILIPIAQFLIVQPLQALVFGHKNLIGKLALNELTLIHEDCREFHDQAIMQPDAHIQMLMPCGHLAHKSQSICNECAYKDKRCLWCMQKVKCRKT